MTQQIRGLSSMAPRGLLGDVAALYTQRSGVPVSFLSVGGVDAERRIGEGAVFDLVVLASDAIDRLAAAGHVDPGGRVDVASSGVGVAVPQGAPTPAIDTEAALRDALRSAGRIACSTGPSGKAMLALLERWGLAEALASRLVMAPPGTPVGTLLSRGEAEIGFQQMSELIGLPGIALLGPLPAALQSLTRFSAAPLTAVAQRPTVRALLGFMASAEADPARARHGLQAPPG